MTGLISSSLSASQILCLLGLKKPGIFVSVNPPGLCRKACSLRRVFLCAKGGREVREISTHLGEPDNV